MLIQGSTTNRLEEEAIDRLASRPKTALNEILERWKCRTKSCINYDHHCWVDIADDKHYPFDSGDASRWAKTIPEFASLERPSDRLRAQLIRKSALKAKGRSSIERDQMTSSTHGSTVNNFTFTMPTPAQYMDRYFPINQSHTNTPKSRNARRHLSTSPAHSESDWRAETERYFEYLINKFPGDEEKFLAAKQTLLANDVDLKAYKHLDHDILEKWDISWGIAERIRRDVKVFQMEDIC